MKDKKVNLSDKQKQFCLEYCKDYNATQAAIRSGYSPKTARQQAQVLLTKLHIQNYIQQIQAKIESEKIMDITEIQERLTEIARGQAEEDVVVTVNTGDYSSEAQVITKKVSAKEQVKALELLGKANSLFKDNVKFDGDNLTDIKVSFVNKSNKAKREKDPKIVGEYTPPTNTEEQN